MLTPQKLLHAIIELLFVLLGGLVIWLGLSGEILVYSFNPRRPGWLILSAAIIVWGLRAVYRPGPGSRAVERWTRGLSLVLLGAVMLAMSRARFQWVGPLVAIGGLILGARGLVSLALLLRPTSYRAS
jgi:hypothetical protein